MEPYAARAEAVIETLGADGTQVQQGKGEPRLLAPTLLLGGGLPSELWVVLVMLAAFGARIIYLGAGLHPVTQMHWHPTFSSVWQQQTLELALVGLARGPTAQAQPSFVTRAHSFHGQRKGDSDFFGDRSWPEEEAAVPVPRAHCSTPCLSGWGPPPSQPWPHWALRPLLPLRASQSLGGSGGLKSSGRTEQSDFLQFCPWKVSPVTPLAASLPANIFPGVVVPGWVGGQARGGGPPPGCVEAEPC